MPKKRHKPEEIVAKLRQVDVMVSQGQSVADAVRAIGVTELTYYRWRQEFGGQIRSGQAPERSGGGECPAPPGGSRSDPGQADPERGRLGKCMVRPRPASRTLNGALNVLRQCIRPRRGARSYAPGLGGYPLSGAPGY